MKQTLGDKIKADYKQYGCMGYSKRVCKSLLRRLGIKYETYYYLENHIDYEKQKSYFESKHLAGVRELQYADYENNPQLGYVGERLKLQQDRFAKGSYKAYGVVKNDKLQYACMISLEEFITSEKWVAGKLKEDAGFMLDAYCSPELRGQGIHGTMNAYRLMKLYELEKRKSVVIVICDNKPALKSQLKVGYHIVFKYYTLELFGRHYTNFYERKYRNE